MPEGLLRAGIVGCGAIGGLFAGHLAELDGVEVWAYDTDETHTKAMSESGLRISGASQLVAQVHATSNPEELAPCDFGVIATKANHTRAAIEAAAAAFANGSVCSVQNGIGNEEVIAEFVPRVMRGTALPAGRLVEPGHVRQDAKGDTWLGPFEPSPAPMADVEQLAGLMSRAGMPSHAMADARGPQWSKLIFNTATNAVGALTGLQHGRVCELESTRRLLSAIVAEGKEVAAALGIELHGDPEAMIDEAAQQAYDHKASMLQDIEARRETEVDFLNGGIATFGEQAGVPTPLNDELWALVKGVESSWRHP